MNKGNFLYEDLDSLNRMQVLDKDIPAYVVENLNEQLNLRPYQTEAIARFKHCFQKGFDGKELPLHLMFNMATGSGKTLIMAALILYLYNHGYRKFLFFVNSTNIIRKTKENFLNQGSNKYLFNKKGIKIDNRNINISEVSNFEAVNPKDINICFSTIQQLHFDLNNEKENSLTFEDFKKHKIVLISDESHHINVQTKAQQELFDTWENTVEKIFKMKSENLLLEFTATVDYENENIRDKYRRKAVYKYDLKQYRNEGYSKDVNIVQSDFSDRERMLQALILNQYKQDVAAKYKINLKPVILFKAQKTIAQSKENKESFHKLIENLSVDDIGIIRQKTNVSIIQRVFEFYRQNNVSDWQLVKRLKMEFNENRCLSVNEENEKRDYQLLLNSLEDQNNNIRAIFAVQKLNEGWDVLNLFDIVRCYETRDSKYGKPGKTTVSEAQLIGRGARYFPFKIYPNDDMYIRKLDNELNHELRVIEELHYHSVNDSRYIAELKTALEEEGIWDSNIEERKLELKEDFKDTLLYKYGWLYINEPTKKNYNYIHSLSDFGVSRKNYKHSLVTGEGSETHIFKNGDISGPELEKKAKDIKVYNIERHIIQNAIADNPFFTFNNLKKYFPNLNSINEFIDSKNYLGNLEITFKGIVGELSFKDKYEGTKGLLKQLEQEIKSNITTYEGENFKPVALKEKIKDKNIKVHKDKLEFENLFKNRDWYAFKNFYGSSEEKHFVEMLNRQIDKLEIYYEKIYLIRNERHFKLYTFKKGKPYEPDYLLFLIKKNGNSETYQIIIEPKGKHLKEYDKPKEDFLKEIKENNPEIGFLPVSGKKYWVLGLPFYNTEEENEFKKELFNALGITTF